MRAIMVMFDSLNRKYLTPYESDCGIQVGNFDRLAQRAVTFDTCYAGSLPCMPARRELHTGRYNFLHRGWGPLEPFDDSVPAMLQSAGVATHLATDHMHYWEDGGATYHPRYGTFSLVRGQQGDPWKGRVEDPQVGDDLRVRRGGTWRQDQINRQYIDSHDEYPQTRTFDAGLEFLRDNSGQQDWFLQIETFDPHEPFDASERFRGLYGPVDPQLPNYDWPEYMQVLEEEDVQHSVRQHYSELVSQCDESLGRVLDAMDEYGLWDDTMLIVCTDHGFLLGEQGWWGKMTPPWYEETVHTPLFVWDPRVGGAGSRSDALVQTIDLGPTLLDAFDLPLTERMQGRPLREVMGSSTQIHDYGLFGAFGGHVGITDGRYVYLRASAQTGNEPLHEHTLMPTHMRGFFPAEQLATGEMHEGFPFTRGQQVVRYDGAVFTDPYVFGTLLFDLDEDPLQDSPLFDDDLELQMLRALRAKLIEAEAPPSQYERLGIPPEGALGAAHLLCRAQKEAALKAREPAPKIEEFPDSRWSVRTRVDELLAHDPARQLLSRYCGEVKVGSFAQVCGEMPLYRAAFQMIGVLPWQQLRRLADELAELA